MGIPPDQKNIKMFQEWPIFDILDTENWIVCYIETSITHFYEQV